MKEEEEEEEEDVTKKKKKISFCTRVTRAVLDRVGVHINNIG